MAKSSSSTRLRLFVLDFQCPPLLVLLSDYGDSLSLRLFMPQNRSSSRDRSLYLVPVPQEGVSRVCPAWPGFGCTWRVCITESLVHAFPSMAQAVKHIPVIAFLVTACPGYPRCSSQKSRMFTLDVASGAFSLFAFFVTVVTMGVALAIALILMRVIPSVGSHGWRQLVDTKVRKYTPLTLSWERIPRLDSDVRAEYLLGFPYLSAQDAADIVGIRPGGCDRELCAAGPLLVIESISMNGPGRSILYVIIDNSPLFDDLLDDKAPVAPYVINGVEFEKGYYLADEGARKDVERAFGVLQGHWGIIQQPARQYHVNTIRRIMYSCIIMHNMILKDHKMAVFDWNDLYANPSRNIQRTWIERCETQRQINKEIRDREMHLSLQQNLMEHIWQEVEYEDEDI
ncbi:ALP1-like protein isoform X1 [Tanacetum coccineum]|uniref:ALP1-like protein isoform X1 n=1 Tax=Tanacetum coccineum TaxID=301880 RepID=A0ABQ5IUX1_9ASTR